MSPEAEPKVCAQCHAKNSPQKNYCDHCGTPLAEPSAGPAGPREIPLTVRVSKKTPAEDSFNLPLAGRVEPGPSSPPSIPITGPKTQRKKTTDSSVPRRPIRIPWAAILFLALGGAGGWLYRAYAKPERATVRSAQEYLEDLARSDFAEAYTLLSAQARANCDVGQFSAASSSPPSSWQGLALSRLEDDAALMKYNGGAFFLALEDGRWTVPFNRALLAKAADAIRRHDPDIAVLSAQSAVQVNPRDPASRGLLCEAYLEHRMPQEAQKECALAVDLSGKYGLEPAHLPQWRQIAGGR